jgi:hypothetical protein
VTTNGSPVARDLHAAVWTGTGLIVWGGSRSGSYFNDGGRYSPTANSWTPVTTAGAPAARDSHTAAWTGSGMLIWGGSGGSIYFNDTFSYNPTRTLYLYQR